VSGFEKGFVYRLASESEWAAAKEEGTLPWNEGDEGSGFFHLSGPTQAQETARLYYAEALGLLALAIPEQALVDKLEWEASTGTEPFPHYYGKIDAAKVDHALRLTRGMGGSYMVVAKLDP
jgi:uncharacterized protein (DUF952 family)